MGSGEEASGGETTQAEGTATAKVKRKEGAWRVCGRAGGGAAVG